MENGSKPNVGATFARKRNGRMSSCGILWIHPPWLWLPQYDNIRKNRGGNYLVQLSGFPESCHKPDRLLSDDFSSNTDINNLLTRTYPAKMPSHKHITITHLFLVNSTTHKHRVHPNSNYCKWRLHTKSNVLRVMLANLCIPSNKLVLAT